MRTDPTVFLVDDDPAVRDVIRRLVGVIGINVEEFSSGEEFLAAYSSDRFGCLVLDLWLPDMTGLELHEKLLRRKLHLPVIIISGHGDIPMTVEAMRKGAIDFLEKPFKNSALLQRIKSAVELGEKNWRESKAMEDLERLYETLTCQEKRIVELLVEGRHNKEMASILDISPRTVESHRASIMSKLQMRSTTVLAQSVTKLKGWQARWASESDLK